MGCFNENVKKWPEFKKLVESHDPKCFIMVSETKVVNHAVVK